MKLQVEIEGQLYTVAYPGSSIAIGLDFRGPQPNTYGVPAATASSYEQDGWVGDVRRGGSCNFETYVITPHCNGTHTECVGHLTADRLQIHTLLEESLIPACVISVSPRAANESADNYDPPLQASDQVLDREALSTALEGIPKAFRKAIVLRTLPNGDDKLSRDYMETPPPFFTLEGMTFLAESGVQHLLVDMPSVDRLFDEGKLRNHRIFWEVSQKAKSANTEVVKTITEMIFVPDEIPDGVYLLNLQVAPFLSDAAPSRPFLHFLQPVEA